MVILKLIFLVFVLGFVFLLYIGYTFYKQIRRVTTQLRGQQPQDGSWHTERPYDTTAQQQTNAQGHVVIDRRSPQEANRQIIADDEGEYVDYEE